MNVPAGARVEVSADGATAGEIRIHGGSGGALIREGSQVARHGGQLPGSPTPEPSPSPASRSTRARQPRPVRRGHPATSPLPKTWAPVHHCSRLRSPGPSATGTSPLKPENPNAHDPRERSLATGPSPPAPRSLKSSPVRVPAPTRRGRRVHRPRGGRRAERPDLGASTRDRRGTAKPCRTPGMRAGHYGSNYHP